MATVQRRSPAEYYDTELQNGDRMTQKEFHRLYERAAKGFKAELIGGIVYVASPLYIPHGGSHFRLGALYAHYEGHTPGVEGGDNTTVILGPEGEPQPDLYLRILPEYGGQSRTTKEEAIKGAPEHIAEIAASSRAIDLHAKKDDYTEAGVLEYLVVCVKEKRIRWFDLKAGRELKHDADGVYRIRTFPGLWIHGEALFRKDYKRLMATLEEGLTSPEHAAFVQKLVAARR